MSTAETGRATSTLRDQSDEALLARQAGQGGAAGVPRRTAQTTDLTVPAALDPHIWPPSPHLDAWAMRVKLEALCRLHEVKQGWIPVRQVRRAIGR